MVRPAAAVLFAALFAVALHGANAQVPIRGSVVDEMSKAGVADVKVSLLDSIGQLVGTAVASDSFGKFAVTLPRAGKFAFETARIGFVKTATSLVEFGAGGGAISVELLISPTQQPLAPITVRETARIVPAHLRDFEDRLKSGRGFIYSREQISKMAAANVGDIIRLAPGVTVRRVNGALDVSLRRAGRACTPDIYFDGTKMRPDTLRAARRMPTAVLTPLDIITQWAPIEDIYGVEVYTSPAQTPSRFTGINVGCGVIAVWSVRGKG